MGVDSSPTRARRPDGARSPSTLAAAVLALGPITGDSVKPAPRPDLALAGGGGRRVCHGAPATSAPVDYASRTGADGASAPHGRAGRASRPRRPEGLLAAARPHRAPTPTLPRPARRPSVAAVRVRGARPGAFSPARCSWRITRSSFAAQARYCSHVAACRAPPNRRTSSGGLKSLRRMGTCQAGPLPTCYGPETGGRPTRRCRGADPASR